LARDDDCVEYSIDYNRDMQDFNYDASKLNQNPNVNEAPDMIEEIMRNKNSIGQKEM
jgi:hypothetical protein